MSLFVDFILLFLFLFSSGSFPLMMKIFPTVSKERKSNISPGTYHTPGIRLNALFTFSDLITLFKIQSMGHLTFQKLNDRGQKYQIRQGK